MATDARERMIRSAALLFRERGVEGTPLSAVVEHSGAPRGSIYHHFPGGKEELVEEAVRWAGDTISRGIEGALAEDDVAGALRRFAGTWEDVVRETDFRAGCPIVAAAVDGPPSAAVTSAFERWQRLCSDALERRGLPPERARALATMGVAAIEGAVILARAERSAAPLDRVADELDRAVSQAIAEVNRGARI
jgi:TetR/AcrR family transcriptional regulator, lmrAB and yxaGH operons repressor